MKRKLFKQILLACVVIIMSLVLIGCGDDDDDDDAPPPPPDESIYLMQIDVAPSTVSNPIPIGVTQQFTATGTYSDQSLEDISTSVAWSSSAPATVSVDGTGLATGEAVGTANIAASASGVTSEPVALSVEDPTLLSITVAPTTVANPLMLGQSMQFFAEGVFDNNRSYDITNYVTWNSSLQNTATIDQTGLATATNEGETDISASAAGKDSNPVKLTTKLLQATGLIIEPQNVYALPINRTQQFVALVRYSNGSLQIVTETAEWTSSDTDVASVDLDNPGNVRGQGIGVATITAKDPVTLQENQFLVEVNDATVEEVIVIPENPADLPIGPTQFFTAYGKFTDGLTRTMTQGFWKVSNPDAAWIQAYGPNEGLAVVAGTAAGDIYVIYDDSGIFGSGLQGSSPLTITTAVLQGIEIWPDTGSVPAGLSMQFTAIGKFSDQQSRDLTDYVTFESSDTTVGGFGTGTKGKLTILPDASPPDVTNASAWILNINNDIIASAPVTVAVSDATLVSLWISPTEEVPVTVGYTEKYTATGILTDNQQFDYTELVTWSSDDTSVATVSNASGNEGEVTGVNVGVVTIRIVDPLTSVQFNMDIPVVQE